MTFVNQCPGDEGSNTQLPYKLDRSQKGTSARLKNNLALQEERLESEPPDLFNFLC